MNPEDNNPLSNPFATGGMVGGADPMNNMSAAPMANNLAMPAETPAAPNLTPDPSINSAPVGLGQVTPVDQNMTALPPVEEPLVPAAPVPGSIGSAVSVPAAEPTSTTGFNNLNDPVAASGPMPAPEVSPSSPAFNPFASDPSGVQAAPAPTPQPLSAPSSAPKPAPAPAPMGAAQSKKLSMSPLVIMLGVLAALLLATSITFFILWMNAKKATRPVYYPQVSDENSNSAITILSCRRNETHENPAGNGTSEISLSYTGDDLSAYASTLSLDFASDEDANAMRDANAGIVENMAALVSGTLSVAGNANGTNYTYTIASQDGTEIAANDAMNAIYGTTEGEPSLALADVQAKYEADGFVCTED